MATNVPTYRCNVCHEFFKTSWERDQHFRNAHVPTPIFTPPLSESEKFFAHLNNGEVELELMHEIDKVPQLWRVLITPKEEA